MDLSDLARMPSPTERGSTTVDAHELVAQMGSEVASTLTSALERVNALAATGRIDSAGLRALRDEVERARRVGMMGQQVSRLAGGRVQVAHERLNLTNLLRESLRLRGREIDARGIEIRQVLAPAEVMSDATLLFSLLQALLDWAFEHAVARIELAIDIRNWPACARLSCQFRHQPADEVDSQTMPLEGESAAATLETMSWRLLMQTAAVLGLRVQRKDPPGRTLLTLEFPDTLAPRVEGLGLGEFEDTGPQPLNSRPLAGRHVLVIAARREVRNGVREAVRPMGLMVDYVTSVEEAAEFCRGALPHAIVYDAQLGGERLERLRNASLATVPTLAFIEIADDGRGFENLNVGGRQTARIGRNDIGGSLPAALSHELTRLAGG